MSFIKELNNTLGSIQYNHSTTEKGALGYRTTQHPLLDMNFKVASYRAANEIQIVDDFMKAFYDDRLMAMKWLFFARDIRGGLGERRLFRVILKHLAYEHASYIEDLIPLIADYGRYDDLMVFINTPLEDITLNYIRHILAGDLSKMRKGEPVTLLAKWLPSENSSSKTSKEQAALIANYLSIAPREYRKLLSSLRKYIGIIESKMSSKEWSDIDYSAVPSRANLVYNKAFLRNDEQRRRDFLSALDRGEVKINSSTLYPHDVVQKYLQSSGYFIDLRPRDPALEGLWKGLPDFVQEDSSTIVVADGSGSMLQTVGNSDTLALSVANALAIYFAERASGEFRNKYITFSDNPQLVSLTGHSLQENLEIAFRHNEVANTNIEAVFELILTTAISSNMKQSDMPQNILIISDMEFDDCNTTNRVIDRNAFGYTEKARCSMSLFETISAMYERHGYKIPRLVFWNVNSRTNTIPVKENELGVALVSGFSPSVVQMVLSDKLDPYEAMIDVLNSERYHPVSIALTGTF